jgi:UDP-GlcNAc:undecaprenyl-phosphate GlcNAc-1-phosphate transferase
MMSWLVCILVFIQTMVLSALLVPAFMRAALRYDVVDHPGERKVHRRVKPLLGGSAIFLSFILAVAADLLILRWAPSLEWFRESFPAFSRWSAYIPSVLPRLLLILGGGALIHGLGLVDDIFKGKLTYRSKFLIQILVITGVVLAGIRVDFMPSPFLDVLITVVWIVGLTNSFNLLDNMDGLTAGVSIVCAVLLLVVALLQGQIFFAVMLAALAGACLGFLFFNFHPSRIFMGDSGSLFLGYIFGTLTVTGSYVVETSASRLPVIMPVLILSIPLYDTFSVMFIRWKEKRPLFVGDKKHFSHRLVDLGMTHAQAVVFIYLVGLEVGLTALLLPYLSLGASILVLVQGFVLYVLITILIAVGMRKKG